MKIFLKPLSAICLMAFLCSLSSCGDNIFSNCEEDYNFYNDNFITMDFLDKDTKQNLLVIGFNRYNDDTVQVYDENLKSLGSYPTLRA